MDDYINAHREARDRSVVLKHRVLGIRSKTSLPIIIMEGVEDVGPYEVWISRISPELEYVPLPAKGKKKLLNYRSYMKSSRGEDEVLIYFIMDHDFDGYQGHAAGDDLFCTNTYSFENVLVSRDVFKSLLNDEFRLHGELEIIDRLLDLFDDVHSQFCDAIHDVNLYLYSCIKQNINRDKVEEKIGKYVDIKLDKVNKIYSQMDCASRLVVASESVCISPDAADYFDSGCLKSKQRGKFHMAFFRKWLEVFADHRRKGIDWLPADSEIKFSLAALTARNMATRSSEPEGLRDFIFDISDSTCGV